MLGSMLSLIASLLLFTGMLLVLVGTIMFLIVAFTKNIFVGFAVIFIPFVPVLFLITNWQRTKGSFFVQLYGVGLVLLGAVLADNNLPWPLG